MGTTNEKDSAPGAISKKAVTALVLGLSLATWLFFYFESMPLSPPETTIVVGGWLVVVLGAKWIWGLLHKKSPTG